LLQYAGLDLASLSERQTNSTTGNQLTVADIGSSRDIFAELLPNLLQPVRMRTVTGERNNLLSGRDQFGAADNVFPGLLDPD